MDKKLRTVIIGFGRMGKTRYEAMVKHGGYEICGLCDTDIKNLENYEITKYTDWKQCIELEKPDAVTVCTYNKYITEIVCRALSCGCHVFSEKPPGKNLSDAIKMKTTADDHPDQILKFGFNHRYHNSVIEAKALLESGLMGEVVCARGVYGKAGNPDFKDEWRNREDISGGGILLDQGIHMADLLRYMVGDFIEVQSSVDNLVWNGMETEDSAFAILRTGNGRVASLHSSALQWKHKFDLDIVCSKGYIALNGLLTSTKSYGEEQITYYFKDLEAKSGKIGNPKEYTLCFDEDFSWELEMREFYESVMDGKNLQNGTPEDAVEVMKLITAIYNNSAGRLEGIR